ncbi:MAG: hypothetical protein SVK08_02705 [Halobacteriota archaeon]|nr:hypothetical protein [Halobacteriota archaeon]
MANFITIFFEIYNIGAAFVIVILIGQILLMARRTDEKVLKARIFLSEKIIHDTWLFMSIAGAGLAVHVLSSFLKTLGIYESEFISGILFGISEVFFLSAFIVVLYQWFQLLEEAKGPKAEDEKATKG